MPIEILMPALSPTMEEGVLSKWLVSEGDEIRSGDVLAEIETDKATMEIEAVEEGRIARLLVDAGATGVKVNAPIAILLEDGEDDSALKDYSPGGSKPVKSQPPQAKEPAAEPMPAPSTPASPPKSSTMPGERVKASPLAKRMASDAGVDLASIAGSGPNGRIVKADVERAKAGARVSAAQPEQAPHEAPASAATEVGMPLGGTSCR